MQLTHWCNRKILLLQEAVFILTSEFPQTQDVENGIEKQFLLIYDLQDAARSLYWLSFYDLKWFHKWTWILYWGSPWTVRKPTLWLLTQTAARSYLLITGTKPERWEWTDKGGCKLKTDYLKYHSSDFRTFFVLSICI